MGVALKLITQIFLLEKVVMLIVEGCASQFFPGSLTMESPVNLDPVLFLNFSVKNSVVFHQCKKTFYCVLFVFVTLNACIE